MKAAFDVLFLLTLFGPALAVFTSLVVLVIGVMTDRPMKSSTGPVHRTPRAA